MNTSRPNLCFSFSVPMAEYMTVDGFIDMVENELIQTVENQNNVLQQIGLQDMQDVEHVGGVGLHGNRDLVRNVSNCNR